ncbi:response regulator transcription factor [Salibacterium halotolerans]|uniref:Two-component system, response regulator YesN n=1 Tax=Salibacterium halotolerans TaxID=1884432 RepID=A0A1I5S877_9BACI|nr:response regulator [Salibacterium halotolerans]SFP66934.1 two-component system, response regulator YesN [Salibacterium halotolerans]
MFTAITVDDEKMIKTSISVLLHSNETGFKIVGEAKDGLEALQLNEQLTPDLIITDIRMPKLNGLKFIEKVKETNACSKFLIISGYDEFEYAQTAIRYGVVDFLLKPLKPDQFLSSLAKVHQQLEADQSASKERFEWLPLLRSSAEDLVQNLWLLEEEQVFQLVHDLHSQLTEKQGDPSVLQNMYLDLIVYMKGELERKKRELAEIEAFDGGIPDDTKKMKETLDGICRAVMAHIKNTRNIGRRPKILSALEYIETNYSEETLSLQEAAETVDMSAAYFSIEFKAEMGISFIQYLTKRRIEQAKKLLQDPSCKTYEIAHSIGYKDYPHFTKTFKKHVGLTPSEYRKRVGS